MVVVEPLLTPLEVLAVVVTTDVTMIGAAPPEEVDIVEVTVDSTVLVGTTLEVVIDTTVDGTGATAEGYVVLDVVLVLVLVLELLAAEDEVLVALLILVVLRLVLGVLRGMTTGILLAILFAAVVPVDSTEVLVTTAETAELGMIEEVLVAVDLLVIVVLKSVVVPLLPVIVATGTTVAVALAWVGAVELVPLVAAGLQDIVRLGAAA